MSIFYSLILISVFLMILQSVYRKHWSDGLSVTLSLSEKEAENGEILTLTEEVKNEKWLPLPMLYIKYAADKNLEFQKMRSGHSETDKNYLSDFFSVRYYQKSTVKHRFMCKKRGYYEIKEADAVSFDLFLSGTLAKKYPVNETITVYPKMAKEVRFERLLSEICGTYETEKYLISDPFTFCGIREYQPSDSLKWINWKASAKTGELKVNMQESSMEQKISIFLDLDSEGIKENNDLKERAISIAATFMVMLSKHGIPVSFYTNGIDVLSKKAVVNKNIHDEGQRKDTLLSISRISLLEKREDFVPFAENVMEKKAGQMMILISVSGKDDIAAWYQEKTGKEKRNRWIIVRHKSEETEWKGNGLVSLTDWYEENE